MEIAEWWPKLTEDARAWLLQNVGSPLPLEISADIASAGGPATTELPDEIVDWVEAIANGEEPE
jgi:hypothetical protein